TPHASSGWSRLACATIPSYVAWSSLSTYSRVWAEPGATASGPVAGASGASLRAQRALPAIGLRAAATAQPRAPARAASAPRHRPPRPRRRRSREPPLARRARLVIGPRGRGDGEAASAASVVAAWGPKLTRVDNQRASSRPGGRSSRG